MVYPPLQHGITHHLSGSGFTPGGQAVYVGTRPAGDGWVAVVIRIDGVVSEAQASWLAACIHTDVLTHLRFANQEDVPPEAVDREHGVPIGGDDWSVAIYVTLGSIQEAEVMKGFLTEYANLGSNK